MAQVQVPLCGQTYLGRSSNIDASRSVNFYPEVYPEDSTKTRIAMVGTPGTKLFALSIDGTGSAVRGMYNFNGVLYAVAGNKLYSLTSGGVATSRGTLSTSTGRVDFSDNGVTAAGVGGNQLMITDGSNGYIYNANTTAFTTIASAGGWTTVKSSGAPAQVEYLDGYFIVTNGTMNYWVSNLYDGTTWGALATAAVTATPDNIVSVINHRQQLFFLKSQTTEVWYDAGTPTTSGSPFTRVSGAVYDYGCAAQWSIGKGGSSFYFLCTQRTADGGELMGVAEVTEYTPVIISTPAINYKITSSTTIDNCFGYCYAEEGHMFYVLTNPDDSWTLVYDASTKMWHERSSLAADTITTPRHLSNCYAYCYGKHFVGDFRNSNIYEMSADFYHDNGIAIWSFRTAQTILETSGMKEIFIERLVVDAETGVGSSTIVYTNTTPAKADGTSVADGSVSAGGLMVDATNPLAYISWSDDSGHTWSSEVSASLGIDQAYGTILEWRMLGKARNRVFKYRVNSPVKKIIVGAYIEGGL